MNQPKYWVCIIGPILDDQLPDGADAPPRTAARQAIIAMTGVDTTCNSGWHSQEEYERIMEAKYRPANKDSYLEPLFQAIATPQPTKENQT